MGFYRERGIADTIAPVIKAFLGRAKATEVLVQQEFVNLLTSRPQVNELMERIPEDVLRAS
jgi:hypothetical protein